MRRSIIVSLLACVWLATLPGRSFAAGDPASVTVLPSTDTIVTGTDAAPSATVRDASNATKPNVQVDWKVTAGGHAADDLDGNGLTPPGFLGSCFTNASGLCSVPFTGTRVTVDSVRALVDSDHDGVADPGEPAATMTIDWRAPGNGASAVRLDMDGCNGDATAPIDQTTWDAAAPPTEAGTVRTVCAARFDSSDGPAPGPVAYTITGGPGIFTDAAGVADYGTSLIVQSESGLNVVRIRSFATGTTSVRVALGTQAVVGSALWTAGAARVIELAGPVSPASGTTRTVTATVLDRFGNRVPSVEVAFSRGGIGRFAAGTETVLALTGADGTAAAGVKTNPGEVGAQTVSAALDAGETDCERASGDPPGSAAGVCRADAAFTWIEAAPELTLSVTPGFAVWGTHFAIAGALTAGSGGIGGRNVLIRARPVGSGAGAWAPVAVVKTGEDGAYAWSDVPDRHTEYWAVFLGDESYAGVDGGTARADVRVAVHLNQSHTRLSRRSAVVFTGRLLPMHPNHPVALQQLTGAGWRTIATTRTGGTGWYSFRVVKGSPGGLLFRTITPSDFHHAWNASRNRRVDWT